MASGGYWVTVVSAPQDQLAHLIPAALLIVVFDEPHHRGVVLKLDKSVAVVYWCVVGQQGER